MTPEQYLKEHGINEASIAKFGLDWNKEKITIPVRDDKGEVIYNKYRHLGEEGGKYSFDKGSHPTLFNIQVMKESKYIFLVEGEMDCIRLDQEGVAAITNTAGAGTFNEEWLPEFINKKVFIIYDNDPAGIEGAQKVSDLLPAALIIKLPKEYKDICEYFQDHDLKDFKKMVKEQEEANKITYKELCDIFDKWLLLPDKNVVIILMATLISHFLSTDPLWMFFVAPPSGSKTEIISTVATLPFAHMLSDLTAQTLASGMPTKKDYDPSLIMHLKNNVLIMKDFTTVLNMRYEDKAMILSQLREIYDGRYSKSFGTGKRVDWEGRLTLIAGVTSIIDTHSTVFQTMGERFVMYRIPQANDVDVAKKALTKIGKEKAMREELRSAMKKFFFSIVIPKTEEILIPPEILDALASLASFVVRARTGLVRDNFKKELTYIPEVEAPARLAKQLGTLLIALAILNGRKEVNWDDYLLTLRVGLDVIPANRTRHIIALCGITTTKTTTQVAQATEYSRNGAELILEDLTALKITSVIRAGQGGTNDWKLSDESRQYFKAILPNKKENIQKIFPETDHYYPLIEEILKGDQPIEEYRIHKETEQLRKEGAQLEEPEEGLF
jgi:5S rRNA maturation endonuclease (ribonuclease M5)